MTILFDKLVHNLFEAEIRVTLSYPSEILAIFIGEGIED